jgi:hypothetical protein
LDASSLARGQEARICQRGYSGFISEVYLGFRCESIKREGIYRQITENVIASPGKRRALRRFPGRGNLLVGRSVPFSTGLEIATPVSSMVFVLETGSQ